jgi:hypothetical protein
MHPTFSWPWVECQSAATAESWRACAHRPLPSGPVYTPEEQSASEIVYDDCFRSVERGLRSRPRTSTERTAFQDRLVAAFSRFAASALGLESPAIDLIAQGFLPAGVEFARRARHFDAALAMPEIVQACRNAWTAYGFQPLLDEPAHMTPSIVGYSLLYPYTDNYLDRRDASPAAKRLFCARFRRRLRGEHVPVRDAHEASIWALAGMIESQYPRAHYPQVFESLLAIHQAQEQSVAQLSAAQSLSRDEILRISCAKGGTSVLADACLVRGWLTAQESQIAFDWGVLLQLGDDLQDIREDLRRGSATLFTRAAAAGIPLESLVIQLLNFSEAVGDGLDCLPTGSTTLKNLLRMSWRSLIIAAVANAPEFLSSAFLRELERSTPLRFAFLRARHRKLANRRGLFGAVFNALIEETGEQVFAPNAGASCWESPAGCSPENVAETQLA